MNLGTFPPTSVPWGKAYHLPEPLGITIAALIKGMWQFPVLVSSLPWSKSSAVTTMVVTARSQSGKGRPKATFPGSNLVFQRNPYPATPGESQLCTYRKRLLAFGRRMWVNTSQILWKCVCAIWLIINLKENDTFLLPEGGAGGLGSG